MDFRHTDTLFNATKMPLNTSQGKKHFSFSKDKRFLPSQQLYCKTSYYDKNAPNTTRTTSFGYGQRSKMASNIQNPSPSEYDPEPSQRKRKGFTFTNSKRVSFVDAQSKLFSKNPAPTKYEKTFFGKSHSFSFRSKYEDPLERHKNKLGPGEYNTTSLITRTGYYQQSKHKASACKKFGREKRFESDETPVPGPGKYKDQLGLDPIGNYFNSRIQSKGIRTFGKPKTSELFRINKTPGPGTYYHFPEFPDYLHSKP